MPQRRKQLESWLHNEIDLPPFELVVASDDASFRRYFRLLFDNGDTAIAMDAPPDKEDCRPFLDVAGRLESAGMHVPHVHHYDLGRGFMLLEDLGTDLYLKRLNDATVKRLYGDAMVALLDMQSGADAGGLPLYDEPMLRREMALFPDWLLGTHLQLELSPSESALLDDVYDLLVETALEQPRVVVHRDYHSRNLMVTEPNPGVIDFQDAVYGPITYDLVSLLRDCYVAWPVADVERWSASYCDTAVARGLITAEDRSRWPLWFDLMGVQRHLKAAGIFARLNHRDGKPGYLDDIPRTLTYIVEVGRRREAVRPLADFIATRVLPHLTDAREPVDESTR